MHYTPTERWIGFWAAAVTAWIWAPVAWWRALLIGAAFLAGMLIWDLGVALWTRR